ncbi:alpha/beta fold hydrolase [Actinophytocola xanthii]|uniref:alpha/beta fold hydrolase n=1 Tax=Actinophytocola xanthii TaxID=1912961 RepID=UPI000AE0CDF7|nr:alpha/beta hydrolase [Actinophytocola xanthii]
MRTLSGAGGVRLALREAGDPSSPPIVLLHGWAASALSWADQLEDDALTARYRLIAADLRGHGESATPDDGYDDPAVWAGDVAALLEYAGRPAVLVGWSYGGLVVTDYLRVCGTAGVAGIVLVGAITEIGRGLPGGAVGPVMARIMRPALSEDPAVAVPALTTLAERMTAEPGTAEQVRRRLADSLRVPARVRAALFRRTAASGDVLAAVDVPVLVVHGDADEIISVAAGEYAAGKIPGARRRWFTGVGHMPLAERAAEFNDDLRAFAGSVMDH